MSDFLVVRGGTNAEIRKVLQAWKASNQWVNLIELNRRCDPDELEINRVNAVGRLRGKHKADLAELILMLARIDVQTVHVKLRESGREEFQLTDWATKTLGPD